ncbi:mandelate racemase/muconate lactonizing enzyme family protein [Galbibacter mesophilus]|uniref:mandelate racemase/muconate lactonizing enzyme family protein n=1 Tax=Galbibacter mesophilus TaxID=379069 RepID=UPI00191D9D27|nr:mandelate racemase/muconate lactonizing enzyme family protein [Galbibacter mesophilus]MCM5663179.1 mandelate racemase/muconate lactonizing enzyme family protein [Galbibacter mesophilus]
MQSNRRNFFTTLAGGAIGGALLPSFGMPISEEENRRYEKLDKVLKEPVLKKELFSTPIIIKEVNLLVHEGNFICKVLSEDGQVGISVSNNIRMHYLYPILTKRVAPFFVGKDARELDKLIEEVYTYKSNYKMQSYAVWVPVATVEFAILDLLGRIANKPITQLIGDTHNKKVGVYQANNFRGKSPEESLEGIKKQVEETQSKALKFKVAGRMGDKDLPEGRSEQLIPMVRKAFGDEMVIYADANGGYDVKEAIRIGKLMQENKFDFFEEPVPFDWYEETKQVKDKLSVPIAGGEQEGSMHNFRWLLGNNGLDIVQPDIFYFGGMIRSMKVAKMAHALGKPCVPHISGSGLGYLYMMHFVSALPNAGPYHEFKGFNNTIPFECKTSDLKVKDGKIDVPTGPGLAIDIEQSYIDKHKKVTTL